MLQKWQETASLLIAKEDIYTKVILVPLSKLENYSTEEKEAIWKNKILITLKNYINNSTMYDITLYVPNGDIYDIYRDEFMGNRFVEYYWDEICNADGIKIKIRKYTLETIPLIFIKH